MRIRVKAWESPQQELFEYEESGQVVDFLERIRPYDGVYQEGMSLVFVDGVRRTEFACYVEEEGSIYEGIFASVGVGALYLTLDRTNHLHYSLRYPQVLRLLVVEGKNALRVKSLRAEDITFEVRHAEDREPSLEVNSIMREELESKIARRAYQELKPHLTICDGTLSHKLRGTRCVGYVKTIKKLFLRREDQHILNLLRKGQRTPIIKLHYQRSEETREHVDKYTWYVKLTEEGGIWSLARLEMFADVEEEEVIRIADLTAGILPRLASEPFLDARSPQNLLPVRELEKALRRHLGHYSLIRNKILSSLVNA